MLIAEHFVVSMVLESKATRQSTEIEHLTTACCRGKFDTVVGTNIIEPVHKKTNNLGFRPGPTQTRLYSHSKKLET